MPCFAPRLFLLFPLEKTPVGIPRHYAAVNARLASGGAFPPIRLKAHTPAKLHVVNGKSEGLLEGVL